MQEWLIDEQRLYVGVTGHHDILEDDVHSISEQVTQFLEGLQKTVRDKQVTVLSPLAVGADQLVAECAMSLGLDVFAVLPFSVQEYEQDFKGEEGEHFHWLLSQMKGQVELKPELAVRSEGQALSEEALKDPYNEAGKHQDNEALKDPYNEIRNHQYVEAGILIGLMSDVVIALWNGDTAEKPGGTSQIVRFCQEGFPVEELNGELHEELLQNLGEGFEHRLPYLYHIPTSRKR